MCVGNLAKAVRPLRAGGLQTVSSGYDGMNDDRLVESHPCRFGAASRSDLRLRER